MVSDGLLEEIRAQADIVQIVSDFVSLRRSGRTFRGPCPLHGGEGPNFSVDPQRGIFKCFVCGEGGDVFSFPMKLLGLEFVDAVRFVAERTGISVPDIEQSAAEDDPYRELRQALAFASDWYQEQLWEPRLGEAARRYLLAERGLSEETVRRFGFGWAPESWRALRDAASVHEMGDDLLLTAGLIKSSERAKEPYDLFRGRLMIPIYDLRDRPIGFGGRLLSQGPGPKYINSPDTPIFHKGRIFYGLNWSRHAIRRKESVLVVEGFMDLVSLASAGLDNVVAPLGTSLTEHQARLLRRYTKRALLLYDSDRAGLVATFKAADELLRVGIHPSVATLPRGEDPDSIVRKGGASALAEYTDAAIDVLDRKIQILRQKGYLESIEGRRKSVDGLLLTVRATSDEALRDIYLDRVAAVTGVRRTTLERQARRPLAGGRRERRDEPEQAPERTELPRLGAERKLLLLLLRDRSLVPQVAEQVEPDNFRIPEFREIYRALVAAMRRDGGALEFDTQEWASELPASLSERVRELAADPEELTNPEAVLEDAVGRLRARALERRLEDLMTEVLVADPRAAVRLVTEIKKVRQELAALGSRMPGRRLFKRD